MPTGSKKKQKLPEFVQIRLELVDLDGSLFLDEIRELYLPSLTKRVLKSVLKRVEQRVIELQK